MRFGEVAQSAENDEYNKRTIFLETLNAYIEANKNTIKGLYYEIVNCIETSGYMIRDKNAFKEDIVYFAYKHLD